MSGKRFVETFSTGVVTDTLTGKEYKCEMRIDDKLLELLNDLHEENHSLKFQLDECRNHKLFSRRELEKENEQLKSEYKVLHTQYQDLKKFVENNFDEYLTQEKLNRQIIKLSDENEQLKNICKNLIN